MSKAKPDAGRHAILWPSVMLLVLVLGGALLGEWLIRVQGSAKLELALRQEEALAKGGVRTAAQIVERTLDLSRTVHAIASLARNYHMRGVGHEAAPLETMLTELAREERSNILQIAIIDEDGRLVFSTVPGWTTMDLSDREHFRVHRDGRRAPFLSAPLVGRASGRWSVQVTQAILHEGSGEFAGVVVVSVDPLLISAALRQSQFGADAFTGLIRTDGIVLARSHMPETAMGARIAPETMDRLRAEPEAVGDIASPFTGEVLTVAWRQLDHWPLVVSHGLRRVPVMEAVEASIARWRMQLLLGLGAVAGLWVTVLLWRSRRLAALRAAQADASRQEMAELVAALPGAAYRGVATPDGRLALVQTSEGLGRLIGQGEDVESQRQEWEDLLDEEGRQARATNHANAILQGESVVEYRLRRADGPWIWVRDYARARRRGQAAETEIVGVLSDITQEREVAAQAVTSAKLATLGEMATGLAHELSQPAAAITLAADLTAAEWDSGDPVRQARGRERLDLIARQTMRMRDIVQHLQIFARRDSNSQQLEAVSLAQALSGALGLVQGTLNTSGIALEVDLPPNLPPVRGQLVPLEQVLVNILLNARDAMEGIDPALRRAHIAARAVTGEDMVELSIRDHGPGFTAEQRNRAFEPFFTTKPLGKGTGLGLAIVYGTLSSFGGRIRLENADDGGAMVVLELRQAEPRDPAAPPTELEVIP